MPIREINFDGIIGPSHNYAGLSLGNLASTSHGGQVSKPRAAALQGVDKMRANLALGLIQGVFVPQPRPARAWLASLGTDIAAAEPAIAANAMSASAMWAANAATVSPAPDTRDGRCHLTVANLRTMPHRSHEWTATLAQLQLAFAANAMSASAMWAANAATVSPAPDTRDGRCHLTVANLRTMPHRSHEWAATLAQLQLAFADPAFAIHAPVPAAFGDEGAANHMRLAGRHGEPGIELFVYGRTGGPFPARQHGEASKAIARTHLLDPARTLFIEQSEEAIAAGAFHNDVVAVANERVLFAHAKAFADRDGTLAAITALMPDVEIVEVSETEVPLADAIRSYLFNAQLVTTPDGATTLIVPEEARETPPVWAWIERHLKSNGAIRRVEVVDVRQSMANGGGPACLRLRVACDPARVDPRFLADEAKLDRIAATIEQYWPEEIAAGELQRPALVEAVEQARSALLGTLALNELDESAQLTKTGSR